MARAKASDKAQQDAGSTGPSLSEKNPDDFDSPDAEVNADGSSPRQEERIRQRAYELWEQSGRGHGSSEDHWLQAEREIAGTP